MEEKRESTPSINHIWVGKEGDSHLTFSSIRAMSFQQLKTVEEAAPVLTLI